MSLACSDVARGSVHKPKLLGAQPGQPNAQPAAVAPLAGTAPLADAWLLVAYPGPWPAKAFENNPIDPAAGRAIAARAQQHNVRPLFIRRYGSQHATGQTEFPWAVVGPHLSSISWHEPTSLATIAEASWHSVPSSDSADAPSDLLYLVCTHGRRDRCCATRGRPVAEAFARLRANATWECSHVGGHRWAGNVVVLPHGLYYGFVDPADAAAIISATERGEVVASLLRGYSRDAPEVQAAKAHAAAATGRSRVDEWHVTAHSQDGAEEWTVSLASADGPPVTVQVTRSTTSEGPNLCAPDGPTTQALWHAQLV